MRYARIARGEAILLKNAEYIEAAKAIGSSNLQLLAKYFFPNVISKILIMVSLDIGSIILYCASLSFLGLGAQPPSPDWGVMISDGKNYICLLYTSGNSVGMVSVISASYFTKAKSLAFQAWWAPNARKS